MCGGVGRGVHFNLMQAFQEVFSDSFQASLSPAVLWVSNLRGIFWTISTPRQRTSSGQDICRS